MPIDFEIKKKLDLTINIFTMKATLKNNYSREKMQPIKTIKQ